MDIPDVTIEMCQQIAEHQGIVVVYTNGIGLAVIPFVAEVLGLVHGQSITEAQRIEIIQNNMAFTYLQMECDKTFIKS